MKKVKGKKLTKIAAIARHLVRYGSITDPVARRKYHTNRLSGYIHKLRSRGWVIETEMCTGRDEFGKNTYAKYRLIKSA